MFAQWRMMDYKREPFPDMKGKALAPITHMIRFPSGSEMLEGYLACPEPEGDALCPGVIVIHEGFGLNENVRRVAGRLADQGYMALAVDLFAGRNRVLCMSASAAGSCSMRSIMTGFTI
jgi:dienelactone hydrolase